MEEKIDSVYEIIVIDKDGKFTNNIYIIAQSELEAIKKSGVNYTGKRVFIRIAGHEWLSETITKELPKYSNISISEFMDNTKEMSNLKSTITSMQAEMTKLKVRTKKS